MSAKLEFSVELFYTLERFLISLNNDEKEMYVMHNQFRLESSMALVDWIKRIYTMSKCSSSCLVLAAYFLKKVSCQHPCLVFSEVNLRRLFLTAVMISAKMNEDRIYKNVDWIRIGEGYYPLDIVNRMECEFLNLLDYELFVDSSHYETFCDYLAFNFQKLPCDENIHSKAPASDFPSPLGKALQVQTPDVTTHTKSELSSPSSSSSSNNSSSLSSSKTPQSIPSNVVSLLAKTSLSNNCSDLHTTKQVPNSSFKPV